MKNLIILALLLGGIAYGGAKFYLHHEVESGLDSAVIMMSPYAKVTYEGVSSTMSGKLTVNGLRAHIKGFNDEIYVDRFGIDTPSFLTLLELSDIAGGGRPSGSEFPEYIGFIVEGMRVPVNADYHQKIYDLGIDMMGAPADISEPGVRCVGKYGLSPAALSDLGYDEQLMSFAMYLRKSGSSELMKMTASIDEMWDAELDLTLAHDTQAALTRVAMAGRKLSELKLVLTDRSINERISKYCEQLGLSPEETLQARLDALHFLGESNGIVFDEYVIDPYKEYLAGKTTLVVTAEPSNPVNLAQIGLYKPSDVPALLNLSATAQ
ncbi:MAG: hypothetical protein QNK34_04540 [Woeseiaceae bacterium]|nr:hypothetical protein [Woeseiaceae bacterium]